MVPIRTTRALPRNNKLYRNKGSVIRKFIMEGLREHDANCCLSRGDTVSFLIRTIYFFISKNVPIGQNMADSETESRKN